MIGPFRMCPSPASFSPPSVRLIRSLLVLLLLLSGAGPVRAQRGLPGLRIPSLLGGLRVSTGVLTAPGGHYRRTSLPLVLGLGLERSDRAGRRWSLEFGYSRWSESVPYRDQVASEIAPEQTEVRYLGSLGVRTFDLQLGLQWPIGGAAAPDLRVGGAFGWQRYEESWGFSEGPRDWTPPVSVDPRRDRLTLDIRLSVPLSATGSGRELTLGYRTALTTLARTGPALLSTADGLRAVVSMPFGPSRLAARRIPRGAAFEPVAEEVPFQLGVFYGLPGIGPEVEALEWGSLLGLNLMFPFTDSWALCAEVATYSWQIVNQLCRVASVDGFRLPSRYRVPSGIDLDPWYRGGGIIFLPEGRDWEIKTGVLSPLLLRLPFRSGVMLGIRRHQEWWDFDVGWEESYTQPIPPSDPGAEVQGVGEWKLILQLGERPQVPQLHLSRVWGLGRIWPDRRRTAVDVDGWRITFMLPLGRF
jgi:hypothetical protein